VTTFQKGAVQNVTWAFRGHAGFLGAGDLPAAFSNQRTVGGGFRGENRISVISHRRL
jgi:hypothetical protein